MNVKVKMKNFLFKEHETLEKKAAAIDEEVAEEVVKHFEKQITEYGDKLRKERFSLLEKEVDHLFVLAIVTNMINQFEENVIDLEKINTASKKAEAIASVLSAAFDIQQVAKIPQDWTPYIKEVLDICEIEYTQFGNYIIIKD